MSGYEQAVFISYAWGEETHEREAIVNQLDQSLQKRGLKIIRDKRDLGYKGMIREFMSRIGEGDCVVVVLSDKYLRSKNCMYELVEIAENKDFINRVFPIVLSDAKIYDAKDRIEYKKYWKHKKEELNQEILSLGDLSNITGITEELNDYDRFGDEFDTLTTIFKNMNTLSPDILRESDFQQLYDALIERIVSTWNKIKSPNTTSRSKSAPKKEKKLMDPAALAKATTTFLTSFFKAGKELSDGASNIWDAINERFEGSPAASGAAEEFVANAKDKDNQQAFELQLKKALKEDADFASTLAELFDNAKSDEDSHNGGDNVTASNNSNAVSRINVGGDLSGNLVIGNNNQSSNVRVGDISNVSGNLNFAGGDISTHQTINNGLSAADIKQLFDKLYTTIDTRTDTPQSIKEDLKAEVEDIQAAVTEAVKKNEEVEESFLSRKFRSIARMAPDILDVVLATIGNPLAGLGVAVKKIADKAKEEAQS